MGQRTRGIGALVILLALALAGCSSQGDDAEPSGVTSAGPAPTYDAALPPAAALLALVPDAATSLTVTNLAQIRVDLGDASLTSASPEVTRDEFWRRATAQTALLTRGMLRSADDRLTADYGFGEDDVDVEAHFFAPTGKELGWVLIFRQGVDLTRVQAAISAKVGPLRGGTLHASNRLVSSGITVDGTTSWASDPTTRSLVGQSGDSTYLQRACLPGVDATTRLEPLTQWSMVFGEMLATATLDAPAERTDLFDRLRLAETRPRFRRGFTGGVADPSSSRIGFEVVDPTTAAQLTLRRQLPFAACS